MGGKRTIVHDVSGYAEKAALLTRPAGCDLILSKKETDDLRRPRLYRRIDRARDEKTGQDPYSRRQKRGEDHCIGQATEATVDGFSPRSGVRNRGGAAWRSPRVELRGAFLEDRRSGDAGVSRRHGTLSGYNRRNRRSRRRASLRRRR